VQSRAKHDRYQERRREAKEKIQKERKKKELHITHETKQKPSGRLWIHLAPKRNLQRLVSRISLRFTDG
jgi:hypothetical protein